MATTTTTTTVGAETQAEASIIHNNDEQQEHHGAVPPASSASDAPGGDGQGAVIESDSEARNDFLSSVPSIWRFLAGVLGLTTLISLTLLTAGLANGQGLQPIWATIFSWSLILIVVVIRRIQAEAATNANQVPGQGDVPRVLDKETRQALLTYFVFDPSKEQEGHSSEYGRNATEIYGEGGTCGGEAERVGNVAGKHYTAPLSPTPTVSPDAATPVARVGAPTTTGLWLEVEDDRERGLALAAAETCAVSAGTDAREMSSSSDELQSTGPSTPHTVEGVPADNNKRPRGSTRPGIEKGSSQWSTTGTCIVCFDEYSRGDRICQLPCGHIYHAVCIDEWFDRAGQSCCPLCKRDLWEELPGTGAIATGVSEGPVAENVGMEAV